MLIDGFGVSGYRSFGPKLQYIGPFKKINLFIGQNNSGKSNILLFLTHHYRQAAAASHGSGKVMLEAIDRHLGQENNKFAVAFGLTIGASNYEAILKKYEQRQEPWRLKLIERLLGSKPLSFDSNIAWFQYDATWSDSISEFTFRKDVLDALESASVMNHNEWIMLGETLVKNLSRGDIRQHWIPESIAALSPVARNTEIPQAFLIPAIRQVGEGQVEDSDYSGLGLIERLAKLQNPNYNEQQEKKRFEEINQFLRSVTVNSTAMLEIPYDRKNILVHMDGRTLPLSSLGTGIHEVIILAAAATVLQEQIVCIEEPEIHLHPLLQKKLLRYLSDKTTNQYFITTHSAHLLDIPNTAIFHVRHQNGQSTVETVHSAVDKASICADLGYRASDILQANCVIWVEGPSDRIYLNHWIRAVDHNLIEGIHYSIMFYGGRLLSHLSASDPEVTDFISLRRLNRYISILIDSDKDKTRSHINETKRRIRDEFDVGPGFAWITKGREIENYISATILAQAIKTVHPGAIPISTDQFDHCLHYRNTKGKTITTADKVKIAHEVTTTPVTLDVLDLRVMINKLVKFIHDSNDFDMAQ